MKWLSIRFVICLTAYSLFTLTTGVPYAFEEDASPGTFIGLDQNGRATYQMDDGRSWHSQVSRSYTTEGPTGNVVVTESWYDPTTGLRTSRSQTIRYQPKPPFSYLPTDD